MPPHPILLIGGSGVVGRWTVRFLRAAHPDTPLLIGVAMVLERLLGLDGARPARLPAAPNAVTRRRLADYFQQKNGTGVNQ